MGRPSRPYSLARKPLLLRTFLPTPFLQRVHYYQSHHLENPQGIAAALSYDSHSQQSSRDYSSRPRQTAPPFHELTRRDPWAHSEGRNPPRAHHEDPQHRAALTQGFRTPHHPEEHDSHQSTLAPGRRTADGEDWEQVNETLQMKAAEEKYRALMRPCFCLGSPTSLKDLPCVLL